MEEKKEGPDEEYRIVPEGLPYEHGYNIKTLWGALFVGFVMLPASIYLGLIMGQTLQGAAQWMTIILFVEVAKRAFVRLRTQEILIIYWIAAGLLAVGGTRLGVGASLFGGPFGGKIWDQYFVNSPQAVGLRQYIPRWLTPEPGSPVFETRSFLHREWILPIVVLVIYQILFYINQISMGYVLFRLTSDIERLPFPMAPVTAGGATALAETSGKREGWRWRVFSIGSMIGVIYGTVYIVVPTLSNILMTEPVTIIPIPWIDFTIHLKVVLPAGVLVLATDLANFLTGMVLPFWVVVGTVIGDVGRTLIANPILHHLGILKKWSPGMTYIPTRISNDLDFWLSFASIGFSAVVFVIGTTVLISSVLRRRREAGGAGRPKFERARLPEGRGDIRLIFAVLFWAASTMGFVIFVHWLVPGFPVLYTIFFGFVITPFTSYVAARMQGITGTTAGTGLYGVREGLFFLSGYKGADIWFAPVPMFQHGGIAETFKQMELTKTKFGSYVKMTMLTVGLMLVCSFIFWSLIWKLGPIPSAAYPFVHRVWPYHATFQALWASSTTEGATGMIREAIKFKYIFAGAGFGAVLFAVLSLLGVPSLVFYGIVGGVTTFGGTGIPMFIGGLFGRYYFRRRFGEKRWRAYAPILLAGYACGVGLVGMSSIAVVMIAKSVSQVVF
ncbi:MAG TPA: peptide transporter [Candidatus Latescibacteria bacterium]|nr:peptide transporter [Candidatus Latescibacterota bacterium]